MRVAGKWKCKSTQSLWRVRFGPLCAMLIASQGQCAQAAPAAPLARPTMPSHNAYDYYAQAGRAMVPGTPTVDPIYGKGGHREGAALDEKRYPLAVKQAWLRQNANALALLQQGFAYPYNDLASQASGSSFVSALTHFRALARILIVESHAREQQDDWCGAANSALDAIRLGHDVEHGSFLISVFVSYAIQATGQHEMWYILPHLDADAARAAAQQLTALRAQRVSLAPIILRQKQHTLTEFREQMRHDNWRHSFSSGLTAPEQKSLATLSPSAVLNDYARLMDAHIANSYRPYTKQHRLPSPGDPITAVMAFSYADIRWNTARNEANEDMLLVALTLRAYELEHHVYAPRLANLVPTYLKQVPLDAFGGGETLRYRAKGNTYILWSIGPDGIDNGGVPINDKRTAHGTYVMPDSKGDMVAGINR